MESKKFRNQLINEKSPYLLQHANNPVDWYSWGDNAFEKAKKENKPIFLSIGYSTCHWCHVMAHESFEDENVAKLLNETFVSIKVDREERPDIDSVYMTVCQMMTGKGGWPLTIIMTPDKKPFFAATYIPKESRYGMMGLKDLVIRIKSLWNSERIKLIDSAEQITMALQNISNEAPGDKLNENALIETYNQLMIQYDKTNGGFGIAPKFPTPHNLIFLLRFWKRSRKKEALEIIETTLQKMRQGGIYDHIGYGFHRYSTDSKWLVPHFEKMLYDQALIAIAYIEAYQATKNLKYSKTAKEIFEYIFREMTSLEGGFYSAEDADSEGEEGKFYLWSVKEINDLLTKDDAELAFKIFNLTDTGNFKEEVNGKDTGLNILHLNSSYQEISKNLDISQEDLENKIEKVRKILFEAREKRIHPFKDDKILTDLNGLTIVALSKAATVFSDLTYLNAAKKAANFILKNLRKPDGRLLHRYRDRNADVDGYLTDYAFFIWGLIELYEASFDVFYLQTALELNEKLLKHYWDDSIGGFFFTADDGEQLITRQKELYDGAIPSGNSISFLNLLRLSFITGNLQLEEKADILSRVFADYIKNSYLGFTQFMIAVDFAVGPSYSLVIAGDSEAEDTKKMFEKVNSEYVPNMVLIYRPTDSYPPKIDQFSNFIEWFDKVNNKATAFVCINKTCKPPTTDPIKTIEYLSSTWK